MARKRKASAEQTTNGHDFAAPPPEPLFGGDVDIPDPIVHEMAVETLTGDLRDFILSTLRHEQDKRPWNDRSESDQRETVHRVESHVQEIVRRAVELIAGKGRRSIKAKLESCTVKDGIKATLILSRFDENRHTLIDATGAVVLMLVADPDEFTGERAPAAIKPDQATLLKDSMVVHSEADKASPFN